MRQQLFVLAVLAFTIVSMAGAANYMYEKASVKGVGYKNVEMIISTQTGFEGQKLVEKESGSGNVITERTELEAERQLQRGSVPIGSVWVPLVTNAQGEVTTPGYWKESFCAWPTGKICPMDYINFTKEAEFEYMPVSYQTGTYDQKWVEKLCVQNYRIGAVLTEMYTHAEHLQKTTEVKTRGYGFTKDPDKKIPGTPGTPETPGQVFDDSDVFYLPPGVTPTPDDDSWQEQAKEENPDGWSEYNVGEEILISSGGYPLIPGFDGFDDTDTFYLPIGVIPTTNPNDDWTLEARDDLAAGYVSWRIGDPLSDLPEDPEYWNIPGFTLPGTPGEPGTPDKIIPGQWSANGCPPCCTGVLEANLNSNVIGVAHIGWLSRDPSADTQLKGRHAEYGRSVEDLTGVFSIEKFIQLWGNSTCGAISVDWLPCV